MLTAERLRELVDYDPETGVFTWRVNRRGTAHAGSRAGALKAEGYRVLYVDGDPYREHRLVWLYVHGRWPADKLDHVNGVCDDNRIVNLRECSNAENAQNCGVRKSNTSGHIGVDLYKGKWRACIKVDGRQRYLGLFTTLEEAGAAYREAKKQLHKFQPVMR